MAMTNPTCCSACFYAGDIHERADGIQDPNTADCRDENCICHTPSTPKTGDWEEEFDEKFIGTADIINDGVNEPYLAFNKNLYSVDAFADDIKSFIRSLHHKQMESVKEEVEKIECFCARDINDKAIHDNLCIKPEVLSILNKRI